MNGKFGIKEAFDGGAFNNNLLDDKILGSEGVVNNFPKFGAFFGFDF